MRCWRAGFSTTGPRAASCARPPDPTSVTEQGRAAMRRHSIAALAASALAVGAVVSVAPAANADLVTYCVGTGGAVTVPGDLFVPPGESCELDGTTVTGNVRIAAGADLVVTGGKFQRDVQIAADGYYDATNTAVTGQVTLAAGGFGIFMRDSGATQ